MVSILAIVSAIFSYITLVKLLYLKSEVLGFYYFLEHR